MVLGEACRAPCRSRPRAIERRVTLSRDRRIITRKRNKLTIVAVAGALSVATAATAAAAVWPSGAPVGKAGTAFATLSQPGHRPADRPASPGGEPGGGSLPGRSRAPGRAGGTGPAAGGGAPRGGDPAGQPPGAQPPGGQASAGRHRHHRPQPGRGPPVPAGGPAGQPAHDSAGGGGLATSTSTPTPSATPKATPSPVPSGSPQSIAQSMLKSFGWSSSQFSCLKPLWQHESTLERVRVQLVHRGLRHPQAAPGSKMASAGPDWKTNERPTRSSGAWATSRAPTGHRVPPGATSRLTAGTDRPRALTGRCAFPR